MNNHHAELFVRHKLNPILTAADWPYPIHSVFNAGATLLQDGTTLLLCRVEDRRGHSHLCVARSANGINNWQIDSQPTLLADPENFPEELWGIEDPRITYVPELKKYAVVYTAFSSGGPGVALALTEDFHTFERYGMIMPPEDKDAALLPHRIGGYWAMIHRPVSFPGAHIWMSYSPDLRHWGSHKLILEARRGAWLHTPEHCLKRSDEWVFGPEERYEQRGDVGNVVFPCGYTIAADGDTIHLYYGAADTSIALATGSIRALLEWLEQHG
ncbi:MAG: glycosidase [Chloroflexi bacterium]|nr:glycosidase [Chloroflexota bacterium]